MATFIGSSQGGMAGAFCATLGVVLPSFFVILIITALIGNLLKLAGVQAFLSGIRPCVVGLILATAVTMFLSTFFGYSSVGDSARIDAKSLVIFGVLVGFDVFVQKRKHRSPSPILMILLAAGLGVLFFSW